MVFILFRLSRKNLKPGTKKMAAMIAPFSYGFYTIPVFAEEIRSLESKMAVRKGMPCLTHFPHVFLMFLIFEGDFIRKKTENGPI